MEGIFMLGLPLVMDYDISNPFSSLGPLLVLGSILIGGVVMAIIGRKMMKKWGK